jgi:hypothetical protein
MEWQAVVLAVQILILAVGWVLFQKAKAELSVKAAETPVLGELRSLKSQIKQLLDEIETMGDTASAQLEAQCRNAQVLIQELEARISEAEETLHTPLTFPHQEILTESFAPLAVTAVSPPVEDASPKKAPRRTKSAPDTSSAATAVATKPATRRAKITATPAVSEAVALVGMAARRQQVFALADEGKEMATIARETDISIAEVETLIGLRGR